MKKSHLLYYICPTCRPEPDCKRMILFGRTGHGTPIEREKCAESRLSLLVYSVRRVQGYPFTTNTKGRGDILLQAALHRKPCRCFRTMENVLHFIFGILGNVFGLALFLAPVITFYKVIRKGSTEEFSGIPYVCALFNCLLYTWYGLPFVSPRNLLVAISNGAGAVLEFIYVCLYLGYAPPKYRMKILGLFVSVLIMFAVIAVVSVEVLHHTVRKLVVGLIAAALSVCMYAAPLSIMRMVIQTKSVEFMPFFLSLFVFLCGSSWLVYGVLGRDAFVAIPNGLGALLGAAQLVLYCVYKGSSPLKTEKPQTDPEGRLPHHA